RGGGRGRRIAPGLREGAIRMFRGRGFLFIVILIVLAAAIFLLLRGEGPAFLRRGPAADIPMDLQNVIPRDWVVMPGWPRECSFDSDEDSEWLVVYQYDQTKVSQPYTKDLTV